MCIWNQTAKFGRNELIAKNIVLLEPKPLNSKKIDFMNPI